MPGKNSRLNNLQLRKKLLVAESELNRRQMTVQLDALAGAVRRFAGGAGSLGLAAGAVNLLAAGLGAFRGGTTVRAAARNSWLHRVVEGAGVASTLWLAVRAKRHHPPVRVTPHGGNHSFD